MNPQEIDKMLVGLLHGTLPEEEQRLFYKWLDNLDAKEFDRVMDLVQAMVQKREVNAHPDETLLQKIEARLDSFDDQDNRRTINRFNWKKYAVAAAFVITVTTGAIYFVNNRASSFSITQKNTSDTVDKKVISPGGNKAMLTLADGSVILLEETQDGVIAQQGAASLVKLGGKLAYNAAAKSGEVLYNTLTTPRGGQYQVTLPDGSLVWLNAASSLRFPTAFIGRERSVEVTGEAYFEIAHNAVMPFKVLVNGAEIHVIGTHFNVMAYNDELLLKTTLLQGAVKFKSNDKTWILKPGQQVQLTTKGDVDLVSDVDVEDVLSWKNGKFHFDAMDIATILRQVTRWYDVDVIYNRKINDLFYAEMPRNTPLSDVLKALQLTGKVDFRIEGKKIFVE
jgi:ferric-dicitrate binding protein FerR (iron transport regulator)